MTAQWEKRLDDIENGMDSYESFLSDLQASVRNWTNQVITAPINPILGVAAIVGGYKATRKVQDTAQDKSYNKQMKQLLQTPDAQKIA